MLALLAAATLNAAVLPPPALQADRAARAGCKREGMLQTSGPSPALLYRNDGKAQFKRLDQLPRANAYQTVLRSIRGCALTAPAAYNVGR